MCEENSTRHLIRGQCIIVRCLQNNTKGKNIRNISFTSHHLLDNWMARFPFIFYYNLSFICIEKMPTITFAKLKKKNTNQKTKKKKPNAYSTSTQHLSPLSLSHIMHPKTFDKEAITEHLIVTAAKSLYWI